MIEETEAEAEAEVTPVDAVEDVDVKEWSLAEEALAKARVLAGMPPKTSQSPPPSSPSPGSEIKIRSSKVVPKLDLSEHAEHGDETLTGLAKLEDERRLILKDCTP